MKRKTVLEAARNIGRADKQLEDIKGILRASTVSNGVQMSPEQATAVWDAIDRLNELHDALFDQIDE